MFYKEIKLHVYDYINRNLYNVVFFFQAEDVIRVSVASRGLGVVYKSQAYVIFGAAKIYSRFTLFL